MARSAGFGGRTSDSAPTKGRDRLARGQRTMTTPDDPWRPPTLPAYPSPSTADGQAAPPGRWYSRNKDQRPWSPTSDQAPGFIYPTRLDPQQSSGRNGFATASLGFGVIGGILLAVPFGIVGLKRSRVSGVGRGRAIAGLILSGVWALLIGAGVAVGAISGGTSSLDVKAGDCLRELPTGTRIVTVPVVACDQPHVGEAYALLEIPKGGFPGGAAVEAFTQNCDAALQRYAPGAYADDSVGIYTLYPTRLSWSFGDRVVTCIAVTETPRTGSITSIPSTTTGNEPAVAPGINV